MVPFCQDSSKLKMQMRFKQVRVAQNMGQTFRKEFRLLCKPEKRRLWWRFVHDWICFFELDTGSQSCGKFDSFIHKCPSALRLMRAEFFGSQKCSQVSQHMPMIRNVTRWLFQKGCMRCREGQTWCASKRWYLSFRLNEDMRWSPKWFHPFLLDRLARKGPV